MASISKSALSPFFIKASAKHSASFIFLHGLGDNGSGWCEGFKTIKSDHINYVFPNAPIRPVTINLNQSMPAWFDIYSLDKKGPEDEKGILESVDRVKEIISEELKRGIEPNRIIVGGFSQGGAVAVYSALTSEMRLGGILMLSSYLPLASKFPEAIKMDKQTPLFQCHGDTDIVIHLKIGQLSPERLKAWLPNSKFRLYKELGHSSCLEEMQDVQKWISEMLPKDSKL